MFRLAELYYERSSDDHLLAMRTYEAQVNAALEANRDPPREPRVDFSPSVAIYRRLIAELPRATASTTAPTTCWATAWRSRTRWTRRWRSTRPSSSAIPKSRFTTEAWVRIGEYYFDADPTLVANPLDRAAEAYEAAIKDRDHPLYDKALYKLGWTYYRVDRFGEAVARFMTLADFYEAQSKARGEESVGGDLREEALQYIAISLIDDKFAGTPPADTAFKVAEGQVLRAGHLAPPGQPLLRPDPARRGGRRLPPGAGHRSPASGCPGAAGEDRPGLRARSPAGGVLRRGREARGRLRTGHRAGPSTTAAIRTPSPSPRRRRRRPSTAPRSTTTSRRSFTRRRRRPIPPGPRSRARPSRSPPAPIPGTWSGSRAARPRTRWPTTAPSASTTRCSSARRRWPTSGCATTART